MATSPAFLPALPLAPPAVLPTHRIRCTRAKPTRRPAASPTRTPPASVLQERHPDHTDPPPAPPTPTSHDASPSFDLESSALREAIKSIAVGKNGEKPIPPPIIPRCAHELTLAESPDAPPELLYLRASFLGSLYVKSALTPAERALLVHAVRATRASTTPDEIDRQADAEAGAEAGPGPGVSASSDERDAFQLDDIAAAANATSLPVSPVELTSTVAAPGDSLVPVAHSLLAGNRLSRAEARALGEQLYAPGSMRPIKALIAHVMRVRHESAEELSGLAQAVAAASRAARPGVMFGRAVALVAEPYDGTITWDLLTPLVCRHLIEQYGLLAVMGVGESAGPKCGPNLRDVARELGVLQWGRTMRGDDSEETREFGLVVEQSEVARGLSEWTWMRRVILKRPAIATVEKYADVSPDGSRLFIGSAFHPGYVDKMATVAQAVGFGAYIIVGRGMEGSIGLGVGQRESRLLIGWRVDLIDSATYQQEDIVFQSDGDSEVGPLPKKGSVTAKATAQKIERFVAEGRSGDAVFDARVETTLGAIDQAMAVLRQAAPHVMAQCDYPSY